MTRLLSTCELSRKLDLPYQTLVRAVRAGDLVPDAISGRFLFWSEDRLPEILSAMRLRRGAYVEKSVPITIF